MKNKYWRYFNTSSYNSDIYSMFYPKFQKILRNISKLCSKKQYVQCTHPRKLINKYCKFDYPWIELITIHNKVCGEYNYIFRCYEEVQLINYEWTWEKKQFPLNNRPKTTFFRYNSVFPTCTSRETSYSIRFFQMWNCGIWEHMFISLTRGSLN